MMKMRGFDKIPRNIGTFSPDITEFFSYTYLPIKLPDQHNFTVEKRLQLFDILLGTVACDFIGIRGLDRYRDSYMYLTAKNQIQRENQGFNRPGWHSDGFGTDDISYIWSDRQPTVFNNSDFELRDDDQLSIIDMEDQADPSNNYSFPNNTIIQMDQYSIHKVGEIEPGRRCFIKVCFSLDWYGLIGNSINHELNHPQHTIKRNSERNVPQAT